MKQYMFTVSGRPVSKARPRVVNHGGKSIAFMPKEYVKYKQHVANVARVVIPEPMRCCKMGITACLNLNKSDNQPSGRKPDLEGIFGAIADGIEGIAYCKDWSVFGFMDSDYYFEPYGSPECVVVWIQECAIEDFIAKPVDNYVEE